jgi:hypothetical protein
MIDTPLLGSKLEQYLIWLEQLKVSKRYRNLKFFPNQGFVSKK